MEKSYLQLEQRARESLEPHTSQEKFDKVLRDLSNHYEAIANQFFYSLWKDNGDLNSKVKERVSRKLSNSNRAYGERRGLWKLVEDAEEYAENLKERLEENREKRNDRGKITEVDREKYSEIDRNLTESWKDLAEHLEPQKQLLFDRNGNLVDGNGNREYSIYQIQLNIHDFFERVF